MSDVSINSVLAQMRSIKAQAATTTAVPPMMGGVQGPSQVGEGDFSKALVSALDSVNKAQQESGNLKTAFEHGANNVSLNDVMLASQKAKIMFQATLQVRNHVVKAYQDVMNMSL